MSGDRLADGTNVPIAVIDNTLLVQADDGTLIAYR